MSAFAERVRGALMVLVPDRLSEIAAKGEVTERYYNPGNLFSEVHVVMTNDDRPDPAALQPTVGDARLTLHNLPPEPRMFRRTLGWRPHLLRRWAAGAVALADEVRPRLVRCHGAHLNAFAAREIKRARGVPYAVSVHINPDVDVRGRARGWRERLATNAIRSAERVALREADLVLPVYQPIVPFLERIGVERYEVAYNALNPTHLRRKDDYSLHHPVRVVSVGRQFSEKDPSNLIRAVAAMPGVSLTLVGDGAGHERLRAVAAECGIGERVEFHRALPNDELARRLPEFDVFATHSEYWELSKSVLEALLAGLPVVLNRRRGEPVPELTPDICVLVDDTPDGFRAALEELIADGARRERMGRAAQAIAWERWAPERAEARYAAIYRGLLADASGERVEDRAHEGVEHR